MCQLAEDPQRVRPVEPVDRSARFERLHDNGNLLTDLVKTPKIGDALDDATQIGSMATAAQRERAEGLIAKGLGEGARTTTGGGRPASRDRRWFVDPTSLADVDNHYPIAQQEISGPVLSIVRYTDDQDAVDTANDSAFGLAGTIWTSDAQRGVELARRVHTGTIGVNRDLPDPVGPFGGVKASGISSELGPEGLTPYRSRSTSTDHVRRPTAMRGRP